MYTTQDNVIAWATAYAQTPQPGTRLCIQRVVVSGQANTKHSSEQQTGQESQKTATNLPVMVLEAGSPAVFLLCTHQDVLKEQQTTHLPHPICARNEGG